MTINIDSIEDFLYYIHGNNKSLIKVYKYVESVGKKCMVDISPSQIARENKNGCIYFIPNIGGQKNNDIHTFTDIFIDLDAGRDEQEIYTPATIKPNGKKEYAYFPLEYVEKYKQEKIRVINNFPLKYTFLIETRNGYHVHYILKESCSRKDWKLCIEKMIKYFDSDPQAKNEARLMRLPFTNWMKYPDNPFPIKLLGFNDVRYLIEDILKVLESVDISNVANLGGNDNKKYKSNITIYHSPLITKPLENIELLTNAGKILSELSSKKLEKSRVDKLKAEYAEIINKFQQAVNSKPIKFDNNLDIYDYLKKQSLHDFLGLPDSFCCIFHEDNNPFAGIFKNEKTGHYLYNCFSGNCGWKGTIIQVTEKLTKLNKPKVLKLLREIYKIDFEESEWQREQRAILQSNMDFLDSDELKILYPKTYKKIKKYINIIYRLNNYAKNFVTTENFTDNDNNALFYASIPYLAAKMEINSVGKFCDRIGLFTFLGLLNKLKDQDIPDFLLSEAKTKQKQKKQKKRVSFFSIPSYTDDVMQFSEKKANEFTENHFTMKGWSREMILRALGEEEANRVYPQEKGKPLSKLSEQVTQQMEVFCLEMIDAYGWTTEEEIVKQIKLSFKGQKQYKKTQIKKIIGEMLQKYDLKISRANKELKKRFSNLPHEAKFTIIYR